SLSAIRLLRASVTVSSSSCFLSRSRPHRDLHSFPTRRSSDLSHPDGAITYWPRHHILAVPSHSGRAVGGRKLPNGGSFQPATAPGAMSCDMTLRRARCLAT